MAGGSVVSLADVVYQQVEHDIINGEYQQGDLLTEIKLSQQLHVSRTPVREALRRLEQEDLVESCGKGSMVLGVTHEDLMDLLEIRLRLEGVATAMCCRNITPEKRLELEETVTLQEFYVERGLTDKVLEADLRFHEIIYSSCGSRVFHKQLAAITRRLSRHRRLNVADRQRAKESAAEHRAILEAILSGDEDAAQDLATQHIIRARDKILEGEAHN